MRLILSIFKPYDALFAGLGLVLVVLYVATAGTGFPLDDSWIHQVYGRNLAERGEWAFVAGQPSAASTSPLYTVLLSIGYRLNIHYLVWTHFLGWLALVICAMTGARMAERLLPNRRYAGLLAGLALVSAWHLVWAAVAGMETMLFSMFTLVLIALAWRELDTRQTRGQMAIRGVIFGALAALTTLTRPEGILLVGLVGLAVLASRPVSSWRLTGVWVISAAVSFLAVMTPYLLLNLQLTGGLLPNTAAAKYVQMSPVLAVATYPERVRDMVFPLVAGGQALLFVGMVFYGFHSLRQWQQSRSLAPYALYLLPLLWGLALILLYAARLPAPYQHGRYVIPALPALIVSGVVGMFWLAAAWRKWLFGRVITRALSISAAMVFAYFAFVAGPGVYRTDVAIIEQEMVTAAQWIAENVPPEELLAVHDIGAVGYFAPRPILDVAGLVNPEVIPIYHDKEALYALMQTRDARYLLAFPDQVPGDDTDDPRLCPLFTTQGEASPRAGGANMTLYKLAWDEVC